MFRIRIMVFASLVLLVGGVLFMLFKGLEVDRGQEVIQDVFDDGVSNTTLRTIHHVAKRDGVREWTLDAKSARYQKLRNRTILEEVTVKFFVENGDTIQVTGAEGILYIDSMDILVSGNVVVVAGSRELKTERLHYDHKNRCVFTDTPVRITGEGITLAGNYMRFSLSRREGAVWGEVKAVFDRPEMVFASS